MTRDACQGWHASPAAVIDDGRLIRPLRGCASSAPTPITPDRP